MIDLNDGTFDQITIIKVLDGGIECLDEVLFGADIVDGDLGDFVIVLCHINKWFLIVDGYYSIFSYPCGCHRPAVPT